MVLYGKVAEIVDVYDLLGTEFGKKRYDFEFELSWFINSVQEITEILSSVTGGEGCFRLTSRKTQSSVLIK